MAKRRIAEREEYDSSRKYIGVRYFYVDENGNYTNRFYKSQLKDRKLPYDDDGGIFNRGGYGI